VPCEHLGGEGSSDGFCLLTWNWNGLCVSGKIISKVDQILVLYFLRLGMAHVSVDVICIGSGVSGNSPKGAVGVVPPFLVAQYIHICMKSSTCLDNVGQK